MTADAGYTAVLNLISNSLPKPRHRDSCLKRERPSGKKAPFSVGTLSVEKIKMDRYPSNYFGARAAKPMPGLAAAFVF